ncbi:MAG: flagellar basal body-associated FliL family protein [Methylobacter sp.]|uniref:Flagellar protein FliL n=1 Tax=Candidatus Methylobacter titanis TaxID=3053457 RepID=A0AA43Q8B1_9GAMM|nr:flagellar basal body-associated FliL family protein [Candidatus Methylobacter titanis]MDI1292451.1 flagellar basal body-associated FliL family protein [Candidatus Methylobacter titanis]
MAELEREDGKEKKSPKKLIIIIVAVVLLLAVSGGAAYFFMSGDSVKGVKAEHVDADEVAVPAEKLYFEMSKPIVVDFPKGSTAKHGRITLSMLVEGAETMGFLTKNEPMIRNNLLMLMSAQESRVLNTREGKDMLRKLMLDAVTAVLVKMSGKGKVNEIFFTSFVMQ